MIIARSDWKTQPWKNGRGITHEIWRYRAGAGATTSDDYDLRLSVAEIDGAQPFSLFPGYQRTLVPLQPTTLEFSIAGQQVPMNLHHCLHFTGDAASATVGTGIAIDLNVIARKATVNVGSVESGRALISWPETMSQSIAVFALGPCVLTGEMFDGAGAIKQELAEFDTFIALRGGVITSDALVVWVRF
jgi:environmental stress-induced protein Ves